MKDIYKFAREVSKDLKIKYPKVEFVKELRTPTQIAEYNGTLRLKKDVSRLDTYFAIAHELRHAWQIANGIDLSDYETVGTLSVKEYNLQEAEIDANAYAYWIMVNWFGVKPLFNGMDKEVVEKIEEAYKKIQKK